MRRYESITFVTVLFFALTPQIHAQQECTGQTIGKVFEVNYYGKPGTKVCLEPGTFSPCKPTPNPPPPQKGTVFGRYIVLTVIYAPVVRKIPSSGFSTQCNVVAL